MESHRLVADIGGTNTRLALFNYSTGTLENSQSFSNADFPSLNAVIGTWMARHGDPKVNTCCLAVAAPPFEDRVEMLNIDWSFSLSEIASKFNFDQVIGINDFEANAHALPHLHADDLITLRGTKAVDGLRQATVGPGTGLGGATLEYCGTTPVVTTSEPGHMGLSPATDIELEIFRLLLHDHGQVFAELLLSGSGLSRLHGALAQVRGESVEQLDAAGVTDQALRKGDSLCCEAIDIFLNLLGSACGDYVLATGSYGGLYIAGGIVPKLGALLGCSRFVERFTDKGQMGPHLEKVPLFSIRSTSTGLLGGAHAPLPLDPSTRDRPATL